MKSRDFCYWLQGFFELSEDSTINEKQMLEIKKHLSMVFFYEIDPSMPSKKLDIIHSGGIVSQTDTVMRC